MFTSGLLHAAASASGNSLLKCMHRMIETRCKQDSSIAMLTALQATQLKSACLSVGMVGAALEGWRVRAAAMTGVRLMAPPLTGVDGPSQATIQNLVARVPRTLAMITGQLLVQPLGSLLAHDADTDQAPTLCIGIQSAQVSMLLPALSQHQTAVGAACALK